MKQQIYHVKPEMFWGDGFDEVCLQTFKNLKNILSDEINKLEESK